MGPKLMHFKVVYIRMIYIRMICSLTLSILKIRVISHECEKFCLHQSGTQKTTVKSVVSHTKGRYLNLQFLLNVRTYFICKIWWQNPTDLDLKAKLFLRQNLMLFETIYCVLSNQIGKLSQLHVTLSPIGCKPEDKLHLGKTKHLVIVGYYFLSYMWSYAAWVEKYLFYMTIKWLYMWVTIQFIAFPYSCYHSYKNIFREMLPYFYWIKFVWIYIY